MFFCFSVALPSRKSRAPRTPRRLVVSEPMLFCFSVVRNKPPACPGLGTLAPEVVRALGGASVNPDRSDQKTEGAQDPLFLSKPLTVGVLHSPQAKQDSVRRRRTRVREPDPKEQRGRKTPSVLLVGVTRFELATSWSRTKRSTKLSHTPFRQKKTPESGALSSNAH